jgi:LPXTG-motif cell wall-anchored protein
MADTNVTKINVIKQGGRWGQGWDKVQDKSKQQNPTGKPKGANWIWVAALTVLMAVGVVVSAYMLYQRRTVVPISGKAATSVTIQDDFQGGSIDAGKWVATGTVTQGNGKLNLSLDSGATSSELVYRDSLSGDFQVSVDVDSATGGRVSLVFGTSPRLEIGRESGQVTSSYNGGTATSIQVGGGTGTVGLRVVRIGDVLQTFYNGGAGWTLAQTYTGATTANGSVGIILTRLNTASASGAIDNFSGQVNLVGIPTPVPGSTAACQVNFVILDLVATPTVTATPVPGATVTPTPTQAPSATPSPTTVNNQPNSCGGTCGSNTNCQDGMFCYNGICRNPSCPDASNCACTAATVVPTQAELAKTGSDDGLWLTVVGGMLLVVAGGLMVMAL